MTPTQRVFAAVVAALFFLFVINAIRRRQLEIQYAVLWLTVAAGIALLAVWYDALIWISNFIGAVLPTTALFLFGILFLVLINIQFSMRISQLQARLRLLAQKHALLVEKVQGDGRETDEPGR
jgi:hypothetical protein